MLSLVLLIAERIQERYSARIKQLEELLKEIIEVYDCNNHLETRLMNKIKKALKEKEK